MVLAVEFRFWWGMRYDPSGAGCREVGASRKLSWLRWIVVRKALEASRPRERACCRYPVGVSLAWSAIVGMGSGRSHWMKTADRHHLAQAVSPLAFVLSFWGRMK